MPVQSMRGVSAGSLAVVLQAVEEAKGSLDTVGDELFAVAGLLDRTPSVRRILTDPSTEEDARTGLAAKILDGKVSKETLVVVAVAARSRWAAGRDLTDAIELAGLAAHVAAADRAKSLEALENELFEAQRIIDGERELRGILGDRTISADHKRTLIDAIFEGKASTGTVALIRQAAATRTGSFDTVLAGFADQVAARRKRMLAEVRTAYELGKKERDRLTKALAAKYGHDVHVNTIIDPSIVGGLRVTIGDDVIDGTVSGRLEDARRQLAG
jgi:F-type H+-transporting ATPase subunit delta